MFIRTNLWMERFRWSKKPKNLSMKFVNLRELLKSALDIWIGKHWFFVFHTRKSEKKNPVVTLKEFRFRKIELRNYKIKYFLASSLWWGYAWKSPFSFTAILKGKDLHGIEMGNWIYNVFHIVCPRAVEAIMIHVWWSTPPRKTWWLLGEKVSGFIKLFCNFNVLWSLY